MTRSDRNSTAGGDGRTTPLGGFVPGCDVAPVAALYVETDGAYFGLPGVDPWDQARDARLYGGHTEGLSHVSDGAHVIVWGGAWDDSSHEYDGGFMPDWWFRSDSDFGVTANPTHWMPLSAPPARVADSASPSHGGDGEAVNQKDPS